MNKSIRKNFMFIFNIFILIGIVPFMGKLKKYGFDSIIVLHNICFYFMGYILIIKFLIDLIKGTWNYKYSKCMILFFLLITIQSIFTSNSVLDSILKIVTLFITYLYSLELIRQYSFKDIIKLLVYSNSFILLITILFIIIEPNQAFEGYKSARVLSGTFPNKNNFATYTLFSVITGMCVIRINTTNRFIKGVFILNLIVSIIFLFMSGSMTSIITLFSVILIYFLNSKLKNRINIVNIGLGINAFIYIVINLQSRFEGVLVKFLGRDLTLTGRTYIWESIFDNFTTKMLWGYGYGTFWGYNPELENKIIAGYTNKIGGVVVHGSHNGFIELMLQIGLIGTIMFIFIIILSGRYLCNINDDLIQRFCSYYYIYILIYFITERSLWNMNYQTLILFIVIEITLNYKQLIIKKV